MLMIISHYPSIDYLWLHKLHMIISYKAQLFAIAACSNPWIWTSPEDPSRGETSLAASLVSAPWGQGGQKLKRLKPLFCSTGFTWFSPNLWWFKWGNWWFKSGFSGLQIGYTSVTSALKPAVFTFHLPLHLEFELAHLQHAIACHSPMYLQDPITKPSLC